MGPLEEVLLAREDREDATETGLTAATGPRLVGSSLVREGSMFRGLVETETSSYWGLTALINVYYY